MSARQLLLPTILSFAFAAALAALASFLVQVAAAFVPQSGLPNLVCTQASAAAAQALYAFSLVASAFAVVLAISV